MEGYLKGGKVDVGWWIKEIHAGEEDRDSKTLRTQWDYWRENYRSNFSEGLFTKNIMFMMRRSQVPRIYFRDPSISVIPKKPGPKHVALAKIMERVFNSLIKTMGVKNQIRKMVDTAFITGTGVLKLGFGAEYTPTPDSDFTSVPISENGFRNEFRSGIVDNMPWILSLQTEEYVLPKNCDTNKNAFFQAHWVTRYVDDVKNDPRLNKLTLKKRVGYNYDYGYQDNIFSSATPTRDTVRLLEIRDRRTRKVIILAPEESQEVLYFEDDELQTNYSSPFYVYTPNPDDAYIWGVSDAKVLEPFQQQMNEIKTKIFWHARQSVVKYLVKKGSIDPDEAYKMTTDKVMSFINVNNLNDIKQITATTVPPELLNQENTIMQDVREIMGFSRNQAGEFNAPGKSHAATATEVQEVKASSELRMDERRDMLSDLLVDIFKDIQLIIFRHWTNEQVIQVVGDDGLPIWVEFTGEMLKEGEYEIQIDPDSTLPETKQIKNARSSAVYQELQGNPYIDQEKLTKYRIRNIPGVAFDDLMKDGSSPIKIVDVNGFASQIGQQGNVEQNIAQQVTQEDQGV